jgi:hypothetical protein
MGYLVGLERVLNGPILVWPLPMLERLLGDCQNCTMCWIRFVSLPLLVASSNRGVSTEAAGRWTYLTTLPLMKTFLTELCSMAHLVSAYIPFSVHIQSLVIPCGGT